MSRLFSLLVLTLLVWGVAPLAAAEEPYARGLFWDVVSPKGQRSVLVGSVHLGDASLQPVFDRAQGLVKTSDRVVLELDAAQIARVPRIMQERGGQPFAKEFPEALSARTRQTLAGRGIPEAMIERMPAWATVLVLAMPEQIEPGMEPRLLDAARAAKKPVLGLETAEEQIDVFRTLPPELLQHFVLWLLDHQAEQQQETRAVLAAYQAEDLARLVELAFEESVPATLTAQQQALVLDQLVNRRNERMLQRLQPYLKSGRSLVAVGALHLPGILEGLSDLGYTVTRRER